MWDEKQQKMIARELSEIELIAESLQRNIGNETTLELKDRIKLLKRFLGDDDWSKTAK